MARKSSITLILAGLAVAFGGCMTTHGNLTGSADRLERNAETLAESAREEPPAADRTDAGYPYSREARALAEQARDFRSTVEDGRTDDRHVRASFERLSRRYHDLRDDVDRSESRRIQEDLKPVTEAYLDVEREMGATLTGIDMREIATLPIGIDTFARALS
jgi:hypothetical protein